MDEPSQNSANLETQTAPPASADIVPGESRAVAFGIAGWLLPGLGHALQRMWGRALVVFFAVGLLVYAGASMRGNVFTRQGSDAFDTLGYIADLGTGSFYLFARALETKGADVSHADGDYGTRLLATAGVLNLLAALHAYEAARGHKA
jgi:mannose/fructose/N-acetylgalactosamine-specific phosphotransferase system component IIC